MINWEEIKRQERMINEAYKLQIHNIKTSNYDDDEIREKKIDKANEEYIKQKKEVYSYKLKKWREEFGCPKCKSRLNKIKVKIEGYQKPAISYQCPNEECGYYRFEPK